MEINNEVGNTINIFVIHHHHNQRTQIRDVSEPIKQENPHLIEDEDQTRVEGEYKGRLVSRYVKPPENV